MGTLLGLVLKSYTFTSPLWISNTICEN